MFYFNCFQVLSKIPIPRQSVYFTSLKLYIIVTSLVSLKTICYFILFTNILTFWGVSYIYMCMNHLSQHQSMVTEFGSVFHMVNQHMKKNALYVKILNAKNNGLFVAFYVHKATNFASHYYIQKTVHFALRFYI